MIARWFPALGAILGALTVAAGAFGAHALKDRLEGRMLEIWETAASYHLAHALLLVVAATLSRHVPGPAIRVSAVATLVGILLFSGSLYLLALSGRTWLGAVTPLGGVAFLVGWIALAVALSP